MMSPRLGVIKPLDKLAGGIVGDRGVTPFSDLHKELHDESRFACSRIAHQLNVLAFGTLRDTHEVFGFGRFETDPIAFDGLVECLR